MEKDYTNDMKRMLAESRKYRRERKIKERLIDFIFKIAFRLCDDAMMSYKYLDELYCDVPRGLKSVPVLS